MWRFLLFLVVLGGVTFAILYYGGALPFSPNPEAKATSNNGGSLPGGKNPKISERLLVNAGTTSPQAPDAKAESARGWDHVFIPNAVVAPFEERDVASRLEEVGYVAEMLVEENQRVKRGQVMVKMDDAVLRAAEDLGKAKAEDEISIQAAKEKYNATYEMYQKDLLARTAVSEQDKLIHKYQMDAAKSEWEKAKLDKHIASLELRRVTEQLKLYQIVSDIDGVVTRVLKKKGETAQRGEVVLKIANYDRLKIEGQARIEQAQLLRPGMKVLVEPENRLGCRVMSGHRNAVTAIAITPDDRILASASKDGNVLLWRLQRVPRALAVLRDEEKPYEVEALATCQPVVDESTKTTAYKFLVGGAEGRARLYTVALNATGEVTTSAKELPEHHRGAIRSVALSTDGKFAATGGADNQIALWEIDGDEVKFLYKVKEKTDERDTAHRGVVTTLQFTGDGALVSAAGDKTIRKWELGKNHATLTTTESGRSGDVNKLGVSKDGNRVLFDFGEQLRIYDLATGTLAGTLESEGQGAFTSLALFAPEEDMILTFTANGRLQLWMAPSLKAAEKADQGKDVAEQLKQRHGYEIRHLVAPESAVVRTGVFNSTGTLLFTGGDDCEVRVWNMPAKAERHAPLEAVITAIGEQIESGINLVRIKAEMDNPLDPTRRLFPGTRVNMSVFPEPGK